VGDTLEFSVILVGKMTTYWKLLVFAVESLGQTAGIGRRVDGRRGRFRLKRVDSIGLNGNTITVYSDTDEFGHAPPITVTSEEVEQIAHSIERENRATRNTQGAIHFITPVCFIENVKDDSSVTQKRLVTDLNFTRLMRELGRRLGSLSEAYCDGHRPKLSELFDDAATIRSVGDFAPQEFERYSRRQRARHPVRGIIGALRVEGDLTPFLPYLRLGEWLHVGKLTTFGLGRYWVES
jgi:hypothetical protein